MNQQEMERFAALVEGYRIALQLKPWTEWETAMRKHQEKRGMVAGYRRTGRTQLGILCAIARCFMGRVGVMCIEATPRQNLEYCTAMARDCIEKLGLASAIRVIDGPSANEYVAMIRYVDHRRDGVL